LVLDSKNSKIYEIIKEDLCVVMKIYNKLCLEIQVVMLKKRIIVEICIENMKVMFNLLENNYFNYVKMIEVFK